MNPIFRTNGIYLGFILNDSLFSRDGEYLGWIENDFVWDSKGRFRGKKFQDKYIIFNRFAVPPVSRQPRPVLNVPAIPPPPVNLQPIVLPPGWVDSF